jgi:hypothetical protein
MTSPTDSVPAEVRAYAEAVRAALADVPADRAGDLLEDLEDHLAEVAADGEGSLESRLGPPADYAQELRAAAGLPTADPADAGLRGGIAGFAERLRASRAGQEVVRFLPELRPAWWVVRAWAAVTAVDVVFVGGTSFPVPTLGLGPVGFVATVAAVVWSVHLGLRARAEGRPAGRRSWLLNGGLAVLALVAVVGVADRSGVAVAGTYYEPAEPTSLTHGDGTPITNVYPYSSDGTPLTGVLLYDQDGRPIEDLADVDEDGSTVEPLDGVAPQPANMFPQQRQVVGWGPDGTPTTTPMTPPAPTP